MNTTTLNADIVSLSLRACRTQEVHYLPTAETERQREPLVAMATSPAATTSQGFTTRIVEYTNECFL